MSGLPLLKYRKKFWTLEKDFVFLLPEMRHRQLEGSQEAWEKNWRTTNKAKLMILGYLRWLFYLMSMIGSSGSLSLVIPDLQYVDY